MPKPRTCPKCDGCNHEEPRHHWLEDGASLTGFSCKHCEAIAVECYPCAGDGLKEEGFDDDEHAGNTAMCEVCQGQSYVEVVVITLEEVERLRGIETRLNFSNVLRSDR